MGNISKDYEALHGASMIPMMVMPGSHSFTPCLDSNNHFKGHDITLSPKLTKREYHEFLEIEKTHIGLISGNGKSPYSNMFEDQEGDQYSSCIILKGFLGWSSRKYRWSMT